MAKTLSDHLLHTLESLVAYDLEKFKFKLQNANLDKDRDRIPQGRLQNATGPVKLAALLVNSYGEQYAVKLTLQVLQAINQNLLVEELRKATNPGFCKAMVLSDLPKVTQPGDQESFSPEAAVILEDKRDGILDRTTTLNKTEVINPDAALISESNRYENLEVAVTLEQRESRKQKLFFLGKNDIEGQEFDASLGEQNQSNKNSVNKGPGNPDVSASIEEKVTLSDCQVFRNQEEKIPGNMDTSLPSGKKEPKTIGNQSLKEACKDELILSKLPFNLQRITGTPVRAASLRRMQESCSICQDMVEEPLGNSCRHHIRYHRTVGYNVCFKCQAMFPKNFQHSKSLGNIPTNFQEPSSCLPNLCSTPHCEHHPKQLQLLFCKDHEKTICLDCSVSPEHKGHRILSIEEAARNYKEQIQSRLEHLKQVRQTAEEKNSQGNETMAFFLSKTESQKEQFMSGLTQVQHFLEEQEELFLAWLEELTRTIFRSEEEHITKASQEISLLKELMGELEEKQKQPAWELLQDIRVTLMRAEWIILPKEWVVSPDLKEKIHIFFWKSECMQKSMRRFIESLQSEMETFKIIHLRQVQLYSADVTLDPETAHPRLIISGDQKSVRLGKKCQKLPNNPQRFDNSVIVLGSPSFVTGKWYWQVYVGDKTMWTLGVCKNSVNRKGSTAFSPGNGYWLIMMTKKNEYSAATIPPVLLSVGEPPRCVGIFLDFEAGDVSFYNATAKSHIFTFPFSGPFSEPLRPLFSPGIHEGGKNTDPLTICTSVNR